LNYPPPEAARPRSPRMRLRRVPSEASHSAQERLSVVLRREGTRSRSRLHYGAEDVPKRRPEIRNFKGSCGPEGKFFPRVSNRASKGFQTPRLSGFEPSPSKHSSIIYPPGAIASPVQGAALRRARPPPPPRPPSARRRRWGSPRSGRGGGSRPPPPSAPASPRARLLRRPAP